jgi:glycosyltransferase involved in cell wall biosynthesis
MPLAMSSSFDVDWADFDALLVSDAGLAKCIPTPRHVRRFVYLHTPMRFVWHDLQRTVQGFSAPLRPAVRVAAAGLRRLDRGAATLVAGWAANSRITAQRAAAAYRIPIERIRVIAPSVTLPEPALELPRRGLLVVSSMQPYKRDDLAVIAATRLGVNLTVAGDGPLRRRLEDLAGKNVTFTGPVTDQDLDVLYRSAEALLFCGEEDFGLIPVEAMVRGTPVVAFRAGGALETVTEGVSGLFFDEQEPESVVLAVETLFARSWDRDSIRRAVERFHPAAFERGIREWLAEGTGYRA